VCSLTIELKDVKQQQQALGMAVLHLEQQGPVLPAATRPLQHPTPPILEQLWVSTAALIQGLLCPMPTTPWHHPILAVAMPRWRTPMKATSSQRITN
jgi:hypothetical protein